MGKSRSSSDGCTRGILAEFTLRTFLSPRLGVLPSSASPRVPGRLQPVLPEPLTQGRAGRFHRPAASKPDCSNHFTQPIIPHPREHNVPSASAQEKVKHRKVQTDPQADGRYQFHREAKEFTLYTRFPNMPLYDAQLFTGINHQNKAITQLITLSACLPLSETSFP